MSIARCVSKLMDRIAPLSLAEKWDNVSFLVYFEFSPPSVPNGGFGQVGLLLGPRVLRLILTTRG